MPGAKLPGDSVEAVCVAAGFLGCVWAGAVFAGAVAVDSAGGGGGGGGGTALDIVVVAGAVDGDGAGEGDEAGGAGALRGAGGVAFICGGGGGAGTEDVASAERVRGCGFPGATRFGALRRRGVADREAVEREALDRPGRRSLSPPAGGGTSCCRRGELLSSFELGISRDCTEGNSRSGTLGAWPSKSRTPVLTVTELSGALPMVVVWALALPASRQATAAAKAKKVPRRNATGFGQARRPRNSAFIFSHSLFCKTGLYRPCNGLEAVK